MNRNEGRAIDMGHTVRASGRNGSRSESQLKLFCLISCENGGWIINSPKCHIKLLFGFAEPLMRLCRCTLALLDLQLKADGLEYVRVCEGGCVRLCEGG